MSDNLRFALYSDCLQLLKQFTDKGYENKCTFYSEIINICDHIYNNNIGSIEYFANMIANDYQPKCKCGHKWFVLKNSYVKKVLLLK